MQPDFENDWRQARKLENAGDPVAAKAIYDRLILEGPDRLYVRLRLSSIEQGFGRYNAAREHALLAADSVQRTGRWKDLAVVTRRLLTFDEHARVHALINKADWSAPDIQVEAAVLGQHLWLIDHVDEALALIDQAMPRMARSPNVHYSRGTALKYFGRMEEATEEFERTLALDPISPSVHWSLAYHRKSDVPKARIPRILKALDAVPADAAEQAFLHYALFKEYDDAGDIDAAWRHLQSGARAKRRTVPYSRDDEHAGFVALERAITPDFVDAGIVPPSAETQVPIFIVGMPRSGTTLLERIVGNHPDVRAGGELNDFNTALSIASDRFIGTAASPRMVELLHGVDFAEVGSTYLRRTERKRHGARYLVDKHPLNFIHAGYIARALPHARILCLRRAPMDACFSNLKELFGNESYGYSYDLDELAGHYRDFARLCEHWERIMPDRFLVVDYEALVADPLVQGARAIEFCGLPFVPEVIDITRNTSPVATASSSQVRQPINTRSVEAWRRYERQLEPLQASFEEAGLLAR